MTAMNRRRRIQIASVAKACEILRKKIARIHEDEYWYRETLWLKGLDESDAADASDDVLDALNAAETLLTRATVELQRTQR